MTHWADNAAEQIEEDYENGMMSGKEYSEAMRDLRDELEDSRQEAAQSAYNDYY